MFFILYWIYYRPQWSCGQGNIFTPVCHSFCSQGGSASVHVGIPPPPPGADTPPGAHPPQSIQPPDQTPPEQTPPWEHPPVAPPPPGADTPPRPESLPPICLFLQFWRSDMKQKVKHFWYGHFFKFHDYREQRSCICHSVYGGCLPDPPGMQTPPGQTPVSRHPPADGHCSRQYASYWNAFCFSMYSRVTLIITSFYRTFTCPIICTVTFTVIFWSLTPPTMPHTIKFIGWSGLHICR